ncbi:MAG: hypothetical protein QOE73_9 [Verrucomicrobiota bacterium]|jgi:hypothetical protein
MKPTLEPIDQRKNCDAFAFRADHRLPITDCHYHSVALGGYNGARSPKTSFRNISNDYFKNEAPHSFVAEASFFAAIVLTAAVPLMNGVSALAHFVRAIGAV